MGLISEPDADLLKAAASVDTPSVIYDLAAVSSTVCALRDDLAQLGAYTLCFSVKANRCPAVLRHLAGLGLGADVASLRESDLALAAGLEPRFATSPGLGVAEMARMVQQGTQIDLDSVSQILAWTRSFPERPEIGLRLRIDPGPSELRSPLPDGYSRFGVDATSPRLHALLAERGLTVVRLHVHAGELATASRARRVAEVVAAALDVFTGVSVVNLGGGWTRLYGDNCEARRAWADVAEVLAGAPRAVSIALEPGMLLTALSGYLVSEVRSVDVRGDVELVTLDASAWNLTPWSAPRVVAALPQRPGPRRRCLLAGCTCYEADYFVGRHMLTPLEPGDRVVLTAAGAYVTAVARRMHGQAPPSEWIWSGGRLTSVEGGDA